MINRSNAIFKSFKSSKLLYSGINRFYHKLAVSSAIIDKTTHQVKINLFRFY